MHILQLTGTPISVLNRGADQFPFRFNEREKIHKLTALIYAHDNNPAANFS